MEQFYSTLTKAVGGSPAPALAAAFVWGVLSIVLSPCHLASIPLIVGFIDKQGQMTTRRAVAISVFFAAGILVTIGVVGAVTYALGRVLGDIGSWGNYLVAGVLFAVGLNLMDVLPAPWSSRAGVGTKRKGLLAAFAMGLVFGIALGPCSFVYMAPMLAVTLTMASLYGVALLAAFGAGHCSVIVLAGTFTQLVQRYLNWNERSGGAVLLRRICGGLVLLGGLYVLYRA